MDKQVKKKIKNLIDQAKVLTLAVSSRDIPWSAPVYYVCHGHKFYFYSNKHSKHIQYAVKLNSAAASIFKDADHIDGIFGLQMAGNIQQIEPMGLQIKILNKYVNKFKFLKQVFGSNIIDDPGFILKKFKSHLYEFSPETIFLSDNSKSEEKRCSIELDQFKRMID